MSFSLNRKSFARNSGAVAKSNGAHASLARQPLDLEPSERWGQISKLYDS